MAFLSRRAFGLRRFRPKFVTRAFATAGIDSSKLTVERTTSPKPKLAKEKLKFG
eukprot:CAMPEP_0205828744 /NCGR_PEP_ID=MMETSP0206-20130828/36033_1 /ASSEMBLY_ACC=CAM_ASM_000279 /TAXON_ID=36767 /ORGANISM="Euplotes focardii, Strain TN1" /LENGTH=53 /DNA_ID=CAMNT_0053130855 /DNA_START=21 /DNA_END=179 /DNA_ORIENTATION=+